MINDYEMKKNIQENCEKYKMYKGYKSNMYRILDEISKNIEYIDFSDIRRKYDEYIRNSNSIQRYKIGKILEITTNEEFKVEKRIFEEEFSTLQSSDLKNEVWLTFKENIRENKYYQLLNHRYGNGVFSAYISKLNSSNSEGIQFFSIRTGGWESRHYNDFINNRIIAFTWEYMDSLEGYSEEEIKEYSQRKGYSKQTPTQYNVMNKKMNVGDIVCILRNGKKTIDLAVVTSSMQYNEEHTDVYRNYRTVEVLVRDIETGLNFEQRTISHIKNQERIEALNDILEQYIDEYNEILENIDTTRDFSFEYTNNNSSDYSYLEQQEIDINDYVLNNQNLIIDGAPGTGKSYYVENELINAEDSLNRVTFYPDYEYHNFVGSILPSVKDGQITYEFMQGHFTQTLDNALSNPSVKHYLVIEELTRGNASAIFGDVFQLLDRTEDGWSEYAINNSNIFNSLSETSVEVLREKNNGNETIVMPPNMSIICTVNSSDQNVYPLDTAFKRRFNYQIMDVNSFNDNDDFSFLIGSTEEGNLGVEIKSWKKFYQTLNSYMIKQMGLKEDKQIGPYFIKKSLSPQEKNTKLALYLWNDVNKVYTSSPNKIFDTSKVSTLSELNNIFNNGNRETILDSLTKEFKEELKITE